MTRTRNPNKPLDQFEAASRITKLRAGRNERRDAVLDEFRQREAELEAKIVARVPEELRGELERILPADDAQEEPGPFGFDVDPADSESLRKLRNAIDESFGWENEEQEEAGDYEARVRQVGEILRLPISKPYVARTAK